MLVIYNKDKKEIHIPDVTTYTAHGILERQDIEEWIAEHPEILGEDLFILTTEYDKFDKTNERLDILAIDYSGTLVVIELKRDDSGKNVAIQAIKYAAYCSNLTFDDIVEIHQAYLHRLNKTASEEEVRNQILNFIDDELFEQLNDRPRIIIVSNNYRPEVTASVLWLRKYGIDIKCIRLVPYEIDENTLGLEATTIIPLPEAEEFIIKAERKDSASFTQSITQHDYIDFYLDLGSRLKENINVTLPKPQPRYFYQIPVPISGLSGIHFEWAFHGRPRSSFGVELHFEKVNKARNVLLVESILPYKEQLEDIIGQPLIIQKDWGKQWSRIYFEKQEGKMTEELKEWAIETMVQMYKFLFPILETLSE